MARHSRRRFLQGSLALAGLGVLSGCGALSVPWQQPAKIPRIGYLAFNTSPATESETFRDGLRELGYVEGRTIVIEERLAEAAEQFPALVVELLGLPVDLIVSAGGLLANRAAMGATRTIPIVIPSMTDPVQAGFVTSLARPGGNVTGLSSFGLLTTGKRLQLLRELVPGVSRIMFLSDTVSSQASGALQETQRAAQSLGMQLSTPSFRTAADLPAVFRMAAAEHAEAVLLSGGSLLNSERGRIVEFAMAARLPLIAQDRSFPAAGGLISYGPSRLALYRRAATYVDKILKGASPADLPVEQPTTFDFVINLTTAQALGLTIPDSVLQQATELIQ